MRAAAPITRRIATRVGFFFSKLFRAIGRMFSAIGRAFANIARTIARSQIGRAVFQIAACTFGGPVGCAGAAAAMTLGAGGSLKDALLSAAISFAQMGVYSQIHGVLSGLTGFSHVAFKLVSHAIVGGASSVAQGGSFESGALSGAVSAGATLLSVNLDLGSAEGSNFGRLAIASAAGGTASVLSGGKFANGAITGAMGYLFNEMGNGGGGCGLAARSAAGACAVAAAAGALAPETGGMSLAIGADAMSACGMAIAAAAAVCAMDTRLGNPANDNTRVHGNSADSQAGTEVYHLINRSSGAIDKIGITSYPESRYSQGYLDAQNVDYVTIQQYSSRYPAMVHENISLTFYRFSHGTLPRLNMITR